MVRVMTVVFLISFTEFFGLHYWNFDVTQNVLQS